MIEKKKDMNGSHTCMEEVYEAESNVLRDKVRELEEENERLLKLVQELQKKVELITPYMM